jgi:hypothetical protein
MYILDEDKLRKAEEEEEEEELENGYMEEFATWKWEWEVSKSLKNLIADPPDYSWQRAELSKAAEEIENEYPKEEWDIVSAAFDEEFLAELADLYESPEQENNYHVECRVCPSCGTEICPECGESLTFCDRITKHTCSCGWQHCGDCTVY